MIVKVVSSAHCPAVGVNVYVVVFILSKAGDQDPEILSKDTVGKAVNVDPSHAGAIAVKVGTVN